MYTSRPTFKLNSLKIVCFGPVLKITSENEQPYRLKGNVSQSSHIKIKEEVKVPNTAIAFKVPVKVYFNLMQLRVDL